MRILLKSKALPAALALLLLGLGIPQTVDSVLWLMTGDISDQPGEASPSSASHAASNAALLEKADAWTGDPRARIRAGVLRLRLATESGSQMDNEQLQQALEDLTEGLARSPANAYGWAALAQAQIASGALVKAKQALSTSMLIDDFDPQLSRWRTELGLLLWNELDSDDRRLWNNQVRLVWDTQPNSLVELAKKNDGVYAPLIRFALLADPARLASFDDALSRRR